MRVIKQILLDAGHQRRREDALTSDNVLAALRPHFLSGDRTQRPRFDSGRTLVVQHEPCHTVRKVLRNRLGAARFLRKL